MSARPSGSPTRSSAWPPTVSRRSSNSARTRSSPRWAPDTAADAVFVPALRKDQEEPRAAVSALGALHAAGAPVDWTRYFAGSGARPTSLPTYPFQRRRFWLLAPPGGGDAAALGLGALDHPLLGAAVALPERGGLVLTGRLSLDEQPWLAGHQVRGAVLLPGTAFAELAVRAGDEAGCGEVEELTLQAPLVLTNAPGPAASVRFRTPTTVDGAPSRPLPRPGRRHRLGPARHRFAGPRAVALTGKRRSRGRPRAPSRRAGRLLHDARRRRARLRRPRSAACGPPGAAATTSSPRSRCPRAPTPPGSGCTRPCSTPSCTPSG